MPRLRLLLLLLPHPSSRSLPSLRPPQLSVSKASRMKSCGTRMESCGRACGRSSGRSGVKCGAARALEHGAVDDVGERFVEREEDGVDAAHKEEHAGGPRKRRLGRVGAAAPVGVAVVDVRRHGAPELPKEVGRLRCVSGGGRCRRGSSRTSRAGCVLAKLKKMQKKRR